jgi:hypothetical protein
MAANLRWDLVALSALFLYLIYGLLRLYLHLRLRMRQREMLYKERLTAIAKGQPLPGRGASEARRKVSLWLRLATAPGMKIASFVGVVALGAGVGVGAGLRFLPDCYVLHDFWSLGLIGVALGLGLLLYALCSRRLTQAVIAERKL